MPRHRFVPAGLSAAAYENRPLPIGAGQTISQPFMVALMTALLDPQPGHSVLEIGTGSGYQAAVLSRLVERVYSVETVPELARTAAAALRALGYTNVELLTGDGNQGWPEHAPYDGIIVTAAAPVIPPALIEQLKPGGKLVIPSGPQYGPQELLLLSKNEHGQVQRRSVIAVAFVPLVGRTPHGQSDSPTDPGDRG